MTSWPAQSPHFKAKVDCTRLLHDSMDYCLGRPYSPLWPEVRSRGNSVMITILVVILLLIALGALPTWPYSRSWGYYPSGGLGWLFSFS